MGERVGGVRGVVVICLDCGLLGWSRGFISAAVWRRASRRMRGFVWVSVVCRVGGSGGGSVEQPTVQ